jgi:hypothetical protein
LFYELRGWQAYQWPLTAFALSKSVTITLQQDHRWKQWEITISVRSTFRWDMHTENFF